MSEGQWGIAPQSRGDTSPIWWGARGIYRSDDCSLDLLWDRMQAVGDAELTKPLCKWLDEKGLPGLRKELKKLRYRGSEDEDIVIEGRGYRLVANHRRSFGYLYIGAWPVKKG